MTTKPSVTRSRSFLLRGSILLTALAVPAVAQILAGHSTLFPRWASAAARTIASARAHVPALQTASQKIHPASSHPNASQPSAQIHFVPEILHAIAGGSDNSRGNDDPADGGPANQARLSTPNALVVDAAGNVYIADTGNALVYRVQASDGSISIVAGISSSSPGGGGEGGETAPRKAHAAVNPSLAHGNAVPGTQVQLGSPSALAVGPAGELYIADNQNCALYKLDTAGNMTVIAGTEGNRGYSPDGTVATSAMLDNPSGVAIDSSGQVYISDSYNEVIRKINPADGTLVTVAGNFNLSYGFSGDGGAATSAQLDTPFGLAFLPNGNLLIADSDNFAVRQVNMSTGIITTVAGNNNNGYTGDGGAAKSAQISHAHEIATDAAGQIYIADTDNKVLRKVALDGTISTIAGTGFFPPSFGYGPFGMAATDTALGKNPAVAVGPGGEVYLAIQNKGVVAKLGPDLLLDFGDQQLHDVVTQTFVVENTGTASFTFTGSGFSITGNAYSAAPSATNGCTGATTLASGATCGIDVTLVAQETGDALGELTITDSLGTQRADLQGYGVLPSSSTTLTVTPTVANVGQTITFTATVMDQIGSGHPITSGTVVFQDDNTGNTLASGTLDSNGKAPATVTPPSGVYQVAAYFNGTSQYGGSSSDDVELDINAKPASITLTASTAETNAGSSVSLNASVTSAAGTPTGSVLFLVDGSSVTTSALSGGKATANIAAPAPGRHTLQAVYAGDGQFSNASSNTLPLTTHGALLQFSPAAATTVAGIPSDDLHGGYADGGPATSARFNSPTGVAVDAAGNIYIVDQLNNVVRKVDTSGNIRTVAGIPYPTNYNSTRFSGDGGPATNAYMSNPNAVAVDSKGNLYIAEYSNHIVRKVAASTGIISTFAGSVGRTVYNGDTGAATSINMDHPSAVAVDASDNLYIADSGNNLIRKVDTGGNLTTIAGNYSLGQGNTPTSGVPATSAALRTPMGVAAAPDGSVYISDTGWNLIRKVTAGIMTIVAGSTSNIAEVDNVQGTASSLNRPQQIAVDAAGNVFISEAGTGSVRKLDTSGLITTPVGYLGSFNTSYYYFDPAGAPATSFQLVVPSGVAVDPNGSLVVTDNFNQTVIRVGPSGSVVFGPNDDSTTPQILTIYNAGDTTLSFGSTPFTVQGNYSAVAGGPSPCGFGNMAPGATCTLTVQNNAGTDGTITFASNAGGPGTVHLHTYTTANPTTTEAGLSEETGSVGDSVLVYAIVQATGPPAAGNIAFYDGATLLGSAPISGGFAYITVNTFTSGTHSITAHYLGQGLNAPSVSDPVTLTLSGPASSTALSVSNTTPAYGSPVTFTATVSTVASTSAPITSGTVTFLDGSTALAARSLDSNGNAQLTTSSLSPGTHTITATFGGNSSYGTSSSSGMTVTVSGGGGGGGGAVGLDYALTLDSVPVVIHRGESKTIGVFGTQIGQPFEGIVTLSCGTLPSYVTCSFSPATLHFGGPVANTTSVLTITAAPATGAAPSARPVYVTNSGPNGMPQISSTPPRK